jgi:hypothetical protein
MKPKVDALTELFVDGALGGLLLAGAIYLLLRTFRRNRAEDGRAEDDRGDDEHDDGRPGERRW